MACPTSRSAPVRLSANILTAGLVGALLGLPHPADAQVIPDGALRPEPGLPRLPAPDYAEPPAQLPAAPPLRPAQPAAQENAAVVITSLQVDGDSADIPVDGWESVRDPASGLSVALSGDERLGPDWVRRQFTENGLIGQPVAYGRIIALIQLINAQFASQGYVNSGILVPPQEPVVGSGPLRLLLVLGRVASGALEIGDPGGGLNRRFVIERLPSARTFPFNAADFEREFRLLAEDPAIATVNADLRPTGAAGEAGLSVAVVPADRIDVYSTFANSRTPSIGAQRLALGGSIRSLFSPGDLLAIEVGKTRGVTDVSATFTQPIISPGIQFFAGGGINNAAVVDAVLAPLDIETKSTLLYTGLAFDILKTPLMPAQGARFHPARSLSARFQFDFRDTRTFLLGERFSFAPGSVDGLSRYYALRGGLDFVSRSVSQVLALAVTVSVGLDGTASDIPGVPAPDRNFVGLTGQANYARRLSASGTEIRARATAQYTSSVTYAGERLPIGGYSSVRGYRETLYLVDNAAIGSIELSQPFRLSGRRAPGQFGADAFAVSAFVDAAWFDNTNAPDPPRNFLAGTGLTLTWTPNPALTARLTWAENFQPVRVAGNRNLQDDGIYFSVTVRPTLLAR